MRHPQPEDKYLSWRLFGHRPHYDLRQRMPLALAAGLAVTGAYWLAAFAAMNAWIAYFAVLWSYLSGVASVLLLLCCVACFLRLRRVKRRLLEFGPVLCLECGYPLPHSGCDEYVTCPECGARQRRDAVERIWRSTYPSIGPVGRRQN